MVIPFVIGLIYFPKQMTMNAGEERVLPLANSLWVIAQDRKIQSGGYRNAHNNFKALREVTEVTSPALPLYI